MSGIGLGELLLQFSASPPGLEQFGIVTGSKIFSFSNESETSDKGNKLYITHSGLFAYNNEKNIFQALQGINVGDFENTGYVDFDKAIHTILFEDNQFNTTLGATGTCMISLKPEFLLSSNSGATGFAGGTGPTGVSGAIGPTGSTGPSGEIGVSGPTGATGPSGAIGATGPTGPSGPTGASGQLGLYTNTSLIYPSIAITADGIAPSQPPTTLVNQYAVNGWYFKNTVASSKINWYLPPSLDMTVGDLLGLYITIFNGSTTSNDNMPFITVYTVPTGTGDFFPGFYRSSMTYIINASPVANKYYTAFANIKNATTPPYYASTLISMIQSPVVNPKGSYLSNEKILAFTISSNSSSPTNSVEFVIQKLGVITANTTQELVFLNNSVNLATNLSLGSAMALPYQSALNTTSFLATGTSGQILRCNGANAPSWTTQTGFSVNFAGNATVVGNYLSPGRYYDTTWTSVTSSSNFTKWIAPTSITVTKITFMWSVGSATATMSVLVAGVVVYTTGTIFGTAGNTVVSGLNITLTSGQTLEISLNVEQIGYVSACMYMI